MTPPPEPSESRVFRSKPPPPFQGPFYASAPGKPPHLYPHVCFACRSSFRRPVSAEGITRPCPRCRASAVPLWSKFKPPLRTHAAQWAKVEALVRAGFFFLEAAEPYPDTLKEVAGFAARQTALAEQWRARWPQLYAAYDEALNR